MANLQQEDDKVNFEGLGDQPEITESPVEKEKPEKETPAESPTEIKPKEEPESSPAPKEEEPKAKEDAKAFHAFHEHPRWIAREKELEQLREKVEEYDEFKERVNPLLKKLETVEENNAPQWFVNLFGDDKNAWSQYQESSKEDRKQIREEILDELKPDLEIVRATKQQKELSDWANKEWDKLGKDEEVQKELKTLGISLDKVQGEISAVMSKYLPTDEQGNISVKKSYEIWKETYKPTKPIVSNFEIIEKKKIGAIDKARDEGEKRDYKTSADFKGLSIADLQEE